METQKENNQTLIKGLSLFDATMLVIGSIIGSGIFIVPSIMAGYVQNASFIVMLMFLGGVFTFLGALSYGELSAALPKAGGQYVFLKEAFSPMWGFLYGWTLFLVIQTGIIAAVAVAFAKYLGVFIPGVSEHIILLSFTLFGKIFSINTAQVAGIIAIIILTVINYFGVKAGAFVQNLFTFLKVLAIILLVGFGFIIVKGNFSNFLPLLKPVIPATVNLGLLAAIAVACSKVIFTYDGWNNVTFAAGEVKNPQKNLPLALGLGVGVTTLVYALATVVYFYVIPAAQAAAIADNRIAAEAAKIIFGEGGLIFISAAILISTFGCNNGLILGGARVYYAMAKDKLFFKGAAHLHPKYHSPTNSLIYQGIWASVLTLSGTYSDLLTYTAFASVLFSVLTIVGLYVLRVKQPELHRPYKTHGYPVLPFIYILISLAFLIFIVQGDPINSGKGLALILLGLPVYYFWHHLPKKRES